MSLFVALELPPDVRAALGAFAAAAARRDRALRPVAADDLHVTLAFLGAKPAEGVAERAAAAVRDAAGPAPVLKLRGVLWLAPRRPHVLTMALEDLERELVHLRARVSTGLARAVGYSPETRPFRPHVTLARVPRGARPRTTGLPRAPAATFAAPAVTLFRSRRPGGPLRYEALERVSL